MNTPNKNSTHPYRAHIDGLRGIAIIAVVLYHAKLFSVTGGFIGVDVFFVISGFLIASIIVRDLEAGTFSVLGFWERRIRRILPIFFVVVVSTVIAAYFLILFPPDYLHFGKTVTSQSTFTSNILFMVTDNYFDEQSKFSPLLHTWSLSVEEQFYIFFPLIIAFCAWWGGRAINGTTPKQKIRRLLFAFVSVLGVCSLMLNIWLVNIAPDLLFKIKFIPDWVLGGTTNATVGFYLLFTRIWELALGILVALCTIVIRSRIHAEILSVAGITAIVTSIFYFSDATAFPGVAALLPTMGTAAFIVANENGATKSGKLLSGTALVFVGLISYSLYLWHWPLFVFAKLASSTPLSTLATVGLCVVAFMFAYLSYRFIEVPFRTKKFIVQRYVVFLFGAVALGILAMLGTHIEKNSSQLSKRIPANAKQILLASSENAIWGSVCFQRPGDESDYGGVCRIGNAEENAKEKFVVWGDSHAEAMVPLLNTLGRAYGALGVVFVAGNCPPIMGTWQIPRAPGCEEEKDFALRYIKDNDISAVVLIARWSYYVSGGQNNKLAALITDSNDVSTSSEAAVAALERTFVPMVTQLARDGRSVYIVQQVPEQVKFNLRNVFYRAVHAKKEIPFDAVSIEESERAQALPNSVINRLHSLPNVHVLNPAELLCTKGGLCRIEVGGKLMYRDESHLSTIGAMSLEPLFTPMFTDL